MQREIDEKIGDAEPRLEDKDQLHYVQAVCTLFLCMICSILSGVNWQFQRACGMLHVTVIFCMVTIFTGAPRASSVLEWCPLPCSQGYERWGAGRTQSTEGNSGQSTIKLEFPQIQSG